MINNAGIALTPTPFDQISNDQFEHVNQINMWGVYYGIQAFLPHLKNRPEANVVNISSLAGLIGYAPYTMRKFSVKGSVLDAINALIVKLGQKQTPYTVRLSEKIPSYFSVAWDMMYSARAVMVRLGLTPRLAAMTEPSATYRFG